jgi:glycosyltransferase involved in cell wall biosynthesis
VNQRRVVLTVNARAADRGLHGGDGGDGARRRTDFGELAVALGATVVDWDVTDRTWLGRALRKRFGFGPVAAVLVLFSHRRYDLIWCFSEIEGLLLALACKAFRIRKPLLFLAAEPGSPKATFFLKRLRVWTHFTAILPTSTHQAAELVRRAGVPAGKVLVLPYQVDCRYFRNDGSHVPPDRPRIVAAGLESRDYRTLIEAVTGLDVDLVIAAASLWSGDKTALPDHLPPNVVVGAYGYQELRDLYAKAALAVVPLRESPYQHGITAIQEAMAMGLPLIVTRTTGQGDVVIDRRRVLRSNPDLPTRGSFAQLLAPGRADLLQSNGFYVTPGDVAELRDCLCYLLNHRDVAASLGAAARRFAEEVLSLDLFVERAVRLVQAACEGTIHASILQDVSVKAGRSS